MGEAKRRQQRDPTYGKVRRGIPNSRSWVVEKKQPCPMTAELRKALQEKVHWNAELSDSANNAVWLCDLEYEQVDHLNYPVFGFFRLDVDGHCIALGYASGACPKDYTDCPDGLSFTWFPLPANPVLFGQLWTLQIRASLGKFLTETHPGAAQYTARYRRESA